MNKHLISTSLLLLVLCGFYSCGHEDGLFTPDSEELHKTECNKNPYLISESEALKIADDSFSDFYQETRSQRICQSVNKIESRLQTRSQESNGWYVINYEQDGGFAVVAADKRIPPILAISDKGHLEMSDTVQNRPLALFFRMAEMSLMNVESENEDSTDTSLGFTTPGTPGGGTIIGDSLKPEPKPDPIPNPRKEILCKIEPLISSPITTWHQSEPYNLYCPIKQGKRCVVGCCAVAGGMIMAYHEYPNSYDWSKIKTGNTDLTARLLATLGGSSYMNSTYGVNATSASLDGARRGLNKMGYTISSNKEFYSISYEDLRASGPMFMSSNVTTWEPHSTEDGTGLVYVEKSGGHAWVIDGCNIYRIENVGQGMVLYPGYVGEDWFYYYYYHCLWGWGGANDGYFYWSDDSAKLLREFYTSNRQPSAESIKYFTIKPNN